MFLGLGIVALVVVIVLLGGAMLVGARHAREENGPESEPTDFVAPTSSGRYAWRGTSESTGEFKARVEKQAASERPPPDAREKK